ncbi:hypothetical protein GCM10018953_51340 [Streptosporangium nondiastaticum]
MASEVKETAATAECAMPCQDIWATGPSGVPAGNPFSGSMVNRPAAIIPAPKIPTRMGSARRPTPLGDGAPDAGGQRHAAHAGEHERGDLYPADVAGGELADRMTGDVEALAGEHLDDRRGEEDRPGQGAGEQQAVG